MTASREALIGKLVVSLHLDVPERRLLGSDFIWVDEVASAVKRLLKQNGVFPPIAKVWKPGELVFEGFFLVTGSDGNVQLIWQRSDPISPTSLADQGRREYDDLDEAISAFIHKEWSKGIDGIQLARRHDNK